MSENIITSNKEGLDALFNISEKVNNFGGRLEIRRVSVEECHITKIFRFDVPTVPNKIVILELQSESGISGYYLPSADELKSEYEIGESLGDMSILKSINVEGVLFCPEVDLKKAKKRIVQGKHNNTKKREKKLNIIIAVQLLILFYFHVILRLI